MSAGPDECWPWTAALSGRPEMLYGVFEIKGVQHRSHRLSYELCIGPIPEGLQVNHTCDFSKCCNPKHLYVGDQLQNRRDAVDRGRTTTGEKNGMYTHPETRMHLNKAHSSKLTPEQYEELFKLRDEGWSYDDLGRKFGILGSSVRKFVKRHPEKNITFTKKYWSDELTEDQISELFELRSEGWGYKELGEKFGAHKCTVRQFMNKHSEKLLEGVR